MARFFPEYSTSNPPASSVSASWVSKGMRESSAGVTTASTRRRMKAPINPMGPTTVQIGVAAIVASANGEASPAAPMRHATPITTIASGNSYAIMVTISRCAPTVAYGEPDAKPPATIASAGTVKRYITSTRSPYMPSTGRMLPTGR
ncbi:MAG: hypothetical protein A4E40_00177 [Methanoregulaceae archaeon PtaU1.Bin059]|nr:MAG: hypothetical protein A4E40_00177 [Methanoregulaceae archaeon PtaU1.Bin059]